MKSAGKTIFLSCLFMLLPAVVYGHFGMVLTDTPLLMDGQRTVTLTLGFGHPFSGIGMELVRPARFSVFSRGQRTDLTSTLTPVRFMDHRGWQAKYRCGRPGVYTFLMEPQPFWEPSEDRFLLHMTKTVIAAFAGEGSWDQPLGVAAEIVPLSRPFGNYCGNTFVGKVLFDGKPAENVPVEIELYNQHQLVAPTPWHETQSVRTDDHGVFIFTCPLPGWWGFAALGKGKHLRPGPDGSPKQVEMGAVLWCFFSPLPTAHRQDPPAADKR